MSIPFSYSRFYISSSLVRRASDIRERCEGAPELADFGLDAASLRLPLAVAVFIFYLFELKYFRIDLIDLK